MTNSKKQKIYMNNIYKIILIFIRNTNYRFIARYFKGNQSFLIQRIDIPAFLKFSDLLNISE